MRALHVPVDSRVCSDCSEPLVADDPFATCHAGCCDHPDPEVSTVTLSYCPDCGSDLSPAFDDETGNMVGWEVM